MTDHERDLIQCLRETMIGYGGTMSRFEAWAVMVTMQDAGFDVCDVTPEAARAFVAARSHASSIQDTGGLQNDDWVGFWRTFVGSEEP